MSLFLLFIDLVDQMGYDTRLRSARMDEEHREFVVGQQAEQEYQAKLRECLDEPHADSKMHPMRRHYYRNRQINA